MFRLFLFLLYQTTKLKNLSGKVLLGILFFNKKKKSKSNCMQLSRTKKKNYDVEVKSRVEAIPRLFPLNYG